MKILLKAIFFVFTLSLLGCAATPQRYVPISDQFWQLENKKVGVVMTATPKISTTYPGAGCLLCLAFASGANSALSKHMSGLESEGITGLKQDVTKRLQARGIDVVVIDDVLAVSKLPSNASKSPNASKKNYSAFKSKYGVSYLVVVDITEIGVERQYSSYIPVGEPQAVFNGTSYMVNLDANTYEWYNPVSIRKGADRAWDEPPSFPAMTNAFYQALETGKDRILSTL